MDPFNQDKHSIELETFSDAWWLDFFGSAVALFGATQNAGAMMSIKKVGGRAHFMMLGLSWGLSNCFFS